jgi:hypothetical protein
MLSIFSEVSNCCTILAVSSDNLTPTPDRGFIGAAAGVMNIYRYFRAEQVRAKHSSLASMTSRRVQPKIGRNELCPCGSGKKFKHCCGKITLH